MRITTVNHAQKAQTCRRCGTTIKPSRDVKQDVLNKRTGKTKKKVVRVLGDSYRWIKFNRGSKIVRCMDNACRFRPSDMTTSDKLSTLYGAQETAEDAIDAWDGDEGSIDDLKTALEDLATSVEEVAEGYTESADNMENVFTGGSPTIDDCREKAEGLESWKDEIEGVDFDEWDGPSEEDAAKCETCEGEIVKDEDGNWKHDPELKSSAKNDRDHEAEPAEQKNSDGQTREEWVEAQREKAMEVVGNCPI